MLLIFHLPSFLEYPLWESYWELPRLCFLEVTLPSARNSSVNKALLTNISFRKILPDPFRMFPSNGASGVFTSLQLSALFHVSDCHHLCKKDKEIVAWRHLIVQPRARDGRGAPLIRTQAERLGRLPSPSFPYAEKVLQELNSSYRQPRNQQIK